MLPYQRRDTSTQKTKGVKWIFNIILSVCQAKLYEKRLDALSLSGTSFKEYGSQILENTQSYRNEFTQKEELSKFKKLCKTFGSLQLHEIKASHILKWQNNTNKAPKTILNYRATLSIIFKYAVYDELINSNPLHVVRAPKIIKHKIEIFTQEEIGLLLKHTDGQLHNIILFVSFSGVRAGELIALRWSDIDFTMQTITISKRIREGIEDVPKSKRTRVLDMLPQVQEALNKQLLLSKNKSEYIFITQSGKPYKRSNKISAAIREICKKAHIKEGTLQTLRRSCNTLYKQYGLPNDWILDQLGHMQEDVNRRHYTGRLTPDLSRIGSVLSEKDNGLL